jgi:hypothetical protein
MRTDQDPPRWAESPPEGAADEGEQLVRELLTDARKDLPTSHQLGRLAAALGPAFLASAGTAVGTTAGVGTTKLVGWVVAGFTAVALTGAGAWYVTGSPGDAPAPAASARDAQPRAPREPARSEATRPAEQAPPPASAAELSPPNEAPEVVQAPPHAAPPKGAPAPNPRESAKSGPSEAQLLESARAALSKDPARALALAREHERRFPRGALTQEREVIAIQALARLERDAEARRRAQGFEQRFPASPHKPKVGSSVDR